jgi:hypothetical protein
MRKCSGVLRAVVFAIVAVALARSPLVAAPADAAPPVSRAVVKLIIGDPAFAAYLHPERPGRLPLLISDHLVADGVTPSFSGQPVRFMPDRELKSLPHIRFASFDLTSDGAETSVDYAAEQVRVVFTLRNRSGWWSVLKSQVTPLR